MGISIINFLGKFAKGANIGSKNRSKYIGLDYGTFENREAQECIERVPTVCLFLVIGNSSILSNEKCFFV